MKNVLRAIQGSIFLFFERWFFILDENFDEVTEIMAKHNFLFLYIVTLSATNVTMFEYTDMMKRLFEKQAEVEQVTDFWEVST